VTGCGVEAAGGGVCAATGGCATGTDGAAGATAAGVDEVAGPTGPRLVLTALSTMTGAVPVPIISKASAAAIERSMILAATKGPRSLIRTVTRRLFCLLVTVTIVPKGRVGWAAVKSAMLKSSPEAVGLP